eukprot:GHVN01055659.1.p1 GENE.GHVN01055659.1~~GHVN01055659.1.p1  ORF type:complete len:752 (+),score=82.54 GHVN01055659.1:47-2257(+)
MSTEISSSEDVQTNSAHEGEATYFKDCSIGLKPTAARSEQFFTVLNQLRCANEMTDFRVITQSGKHVSCHAVVLACSSEVLKAMMNSSMAEATRRQVVVDQYPDGVVEALVAYFYTGAFLVSYCNLQNSIMAADYFQLVELRDELALHAVQYITPENVKGWDYIATQLNLPTLAGRTKKVSYQKEHGVTLTELRSYLHISETPDDMVRAIIDWHKKDSAFRGADTLSLLETVPLAQCMRSTIEKAQQTLSGCLADFRTDSRTEESDDTNTTNTANDIFSPFETATSAVVRTSVASRLHLIVGTYNSPKTRSGLSLWRLSSPSASTWSRIALPVFWNGDVHPHFGSVLSPVGLIIWSISPSVLQVGIQKSRFEAHTQWGVGWERSNHMLELGGVARGTNFTSVYSQGKIYIITVRLSHGSASPTIPPSAGSSSTSVASSRSSAGRRYSQTAAESREGGSCNRANKGEIIHEVKVAWYDVGNKEWRVGPTKMCGGPEEKKDGPRPSVLSVVVSSGDLYIISLGVLMRMNSEKAINGAEGSLCSDSSDIACGLETKLSPPFLLNACCACSDQHDKIWIGCGDGRVRCYDTRSHQWVQSAELTRGGLAKDSSCTTQTSIEQGLSRSRPIHIVGLKCSGNLLIWWDDQNEVHRSAAEIGQRRSSGSGGLSLSRCSSYSPEHQQCLSVSEYKQATLELSDVCLFSPAERGRNGRADNGWKRIGGGDSGLVFVLDAWSPVDGW